MLTTGARLKEERDRLHISQKAFGAIAGVTKTSQVNYENDHRSPDAAYLAALALQGVDVQYVVTGVQAAALGPEEAELMRRYRAASPEIRGAVMAALGAVLEPKKRQGPAVAISGGQQAQVIAGGAKQDKVTINLGAKKRGSKKRLV